MVRWMMVLTALVGCEPKAPAGDSGTAEETATDTEDSTDTAEDWNFSGYDGRLEQRIAIDDPAVIQCDLFWVFLGEPATPCPDCVFAMTLDLIYDAASSDNAAGCIEDASAANFTLTLGYDEAYADSGVPVLWLYDADAQSWAPAFEASLDPSTGALSFQATLEEAPDQDTVVYKSVYGEGTLRRAATTRGSAPVFPTSGLNPLVARKLPVAQNGRNR